MTICSEVCLKCLYFVSHTFSNTKIFRWTGYQLPVVMVVIVIMIIAVTIALVIVDNNNNNDTHSTTIPNNKRKTEPILIRTK